MIVHLGVVMVAVALASATSFGHRSQTTLQVGQSSVVDGHTFEFLGLTEVTTPASVATEALVRVDGGGIFRPAVTSFGSNTEAVGTPAIDSSLVDDVYLTIDTLPLTRGGPVTIGVTIQPLVIWLWIGGGVLVAGSALAVVPVRRRRRDGVITSRPPDTAGSKPQQNEVDENTREQRVDEQVEEPVGAPVP
jgi:cytochrome c-type biogenesis protein CcmF